MDEACRDFTVGADNTALWVVTVRHVGRSAIVIGYVEHGVRGGVVHMWLCGHSGPWKCHKVISVAAHKVSALHARRPLVDVNVPVLDLGKKARQGSLGSLLLGLLGRARVGYRNCGRAIIGVDATDDLLG